MFFIKTIQNRLRERAEQKRIKEEKKRKWCERQNQYYDIGDIIYHSSLECLQFHVNESKQSRELCGS